MADLDAHPDCVKNGCWRLEYDALPAGEANRECSAPSAGTDLHSIEHVRHCYEVVIWDMERRGFQISSLIRNLRQLAEREVIDLRPVPANGADGSQTASPEAKK